jgi:hypothetical protein
MAKLCRIHFSGMGNSAARLNPVTLDFRGREGEPTHTVLWLRNGGGKTTMLSLFYSVILPAKREWLGRFHDKPTEVGDYMEEKELGYIIIEFAFADGTRRIVGQSLVKRSRQDVSRVCFSLRADGPVRLESLPIVGLSAPPAKTRDEFFGFLEDANKRDPRGVEFVRFDLGQRSLREWERHLIDIGVDPAVYRSHLVMNSDEGGLGAFFDFKASDEFVARLLEMADDPVVLPDDAAASDQTADVVQRFRAKILNLPNLETEDRFCLEMEAGLTQYRSVFLTAQQAGQALLAARVDAAKFLVAVKACLDDCRTRLKALEVQKASHVIEQQKAEGEVNTHSKYRQTYDRQGVELRQKEAVVEREKCAGLEQAARAELLLLQAAEKYKDFQHWANEVRTLQEEMEALLADRRPEVSLVHNLATTLQHRLEQRVQMIARDIEEIGQVRRKAKEVAAANDQELKELRDRVVSLTKDLEAVRAKMQADDRERRGLREKGIILEGETAPTTLSGLTATISEAARQIENGREEARTHRAKAAGHRDAAKDQRERARKEGQCAAEVETRIGIARAAGENLRASRTIQKHGGSAPDLYNPGLMHAIITEGDALGAEIISRAMIRAADDRILARHDPPGHPLFPGPLAVERVIDLLRSKGVRSAISRYEWLNANCGLGETEFHLRAHPAAAAGILLQDPNELALASTIGSAPEIDVPVFITVPSTDLSTPGAGHVVLPMEKGYFNAVTATASRGVIEERVKSAQRDQDRLSQDRKDVDKICHGLQEFLRSYPAEKVSAWHADLQRRQATVAALTAQAHSEEEAAIADDQKANDCTIAADKAQDSKAQLTSQQAMVARYVEDYYSKREGWQTEEKGLVQAQAEASRGALVAEEDLRGLRAKDELLEKDIADRQRDKQSWGFRRDSVPKQFCDGAVEISPLGIDELEQLFNLKRESLEMAINASGLPGRIQVASAARARAQRAYASVAEPSGLREEDVTAAVSLNEDLSRAIVLQEADLLAKQRAFNLADQEFKLAQNEARTPLLRDQRATVKTEWGDAVTRAQALEFVARCRVIEAENAEAAQRARDRINGLSASSLEVSLLAKTLDLWPGELERICADVAPQEPHPLFTPNEKVVDVLKKVRSEVESRQKHFGDRQISATQVYTDKVIAIVNRPDFAVAGMEIRERLARLTRPQLDNGLDEIISAITERLSVVEQSLAAVEADRKNVVAAMEQRANDAVGLLRSAHRLSKMPAEIGVWAGREFMKFSIPIKNDDAERVSYLRRLLAYWVESKDAVPSGHKMAFECLMATIGSLDGSGKPRPSGSIGVEILKPEANLRLYYHPIEAMRTFSGGELVTTAIILYCVLARLRAQRRGHDATLLAKDAGFLLLDNPVGKANLPDFLDLQINIAEIVGVQYICGTGINDLEALGAFPKILRMRNSSINPRTGANVVQVTGEVGNTVTAVQVAAKTQLMAKRPASQ